MKSPVTRRPQLKDQFRRPPARRHALRRTSQRRAKVFHLPWPQQPKRQRPYPPLAACHWRKAAAPAHGRLIPSQKCSSESSCCNSRLTAAIDPRCVPSLFSAIRTALSRMEAGGAPVSFVEHQRGVRFRPRSPDTCANCFAYAQNAIKPSIGQYNPKRRTSIRTTQFQSFLTSFADRNER